MLETAEQHHQTIEIASDLVSTVAECIGVAIAASPALRAVGICLDDPSLRSELVEALRRERVTNFRIVDRKQAIASYHKRVNKPAGFLSAHTVMALGAAPIEIAPGPRRKRAPARPLERRVEES